MSFLTRRVTYSPNDLHQIPFQVHTVYSGSLFASSFQGIQVNNFSAGSIIIDYTIHFADNTSQEIIVNTTTLAEDFESSYMEVVAAGMVDVVIDTQSIIVVGEYDEYLWSIAFFFSTLVNQL